MFERLNLKELHPAVASSFKGDSHSSTKPSVFHLHLKIIDVLNITEFCAAKRQKADNRFDEWFRFFILFINTHTHARRHTPKNITN